MPTSKWLFCVTYSRIEVSLVRGFLRGSSKSSNHIFQADKADRWFTIRNKHSGNFLTSTSGSEVEIGERWVPAVEDAPKVITIVIEPYAESDLSCCDKVIMVKDFKMTKEVKERMAKLCGTTNFSLALRNSEHVARYIQTGHWMSQQMLGDSPMKEFLNNIEKAEIRDRYKRPIEAKKFLNIAPKELEMQPASDLILYPEIKHSHAIQHSSNAPLLLTDAEKEAFNIVVLGPSGAGKSTIINNFFNKSVCPTGASAFSITQEVRFYHGKIPVGKLNNFEKINIIDTIGFCDSVLTEDEVFKSIKHTLEANVIYIDKVIILSSNRLEAVQVKAISQCMDWLKFKDHKKKFSFILNKSDNLTENEKMESLAFICDKLDADLTTSFEEKRGDLTYQIPLNQAFGFPRNAKYEEVEDSLKNLIAITLAEIEPENRIELHPRKSMCVIQ